MTVIGTGPSPIGDPAGFVALARAAPTFRAEGVLTGSDGPWHWWVIDPERHPLQVWRRTIGVASYARSATALGATVFSNGPLIGRRNRLGGKLSRRRAAWELAWWTTLGAVAGGSASIARSPSIAQSPLIARSPWTSRSRWPARLLARTAGLLVGAAAGLGLAWRRVFTGWVPCGGVVAGSAGIQDRRNFDAEGDQHAWIGRTGTNFGSYTVAEGDVPAGVSEGMGGMLLLVREHQLVRREPGRPGYREDFADHADKPGVVAWALVPDDDGSGVLMVLGGQAVTAAQAAVLLGDLGARDAVATDQGRCAMLGQRREFTLARPSLPRRTMQVYGLCCR